MFTIKLLLISFFDFITFPYLSLKSNDDISLFNSGFVLAKAMYVSYSSLLDVALAAPIRPKVDKREEKVSDGEIRSFVFAL